MTAVPLLPCRRLSAVRLLPVLTAILALAGLAGCAKKAAAPTGGRGGGGGPAPVTTAKVEHKVMPVALNAIGSVEPIRTASVRSQVTGVLMKLHFQEGQEVKEGDLLFEIDSRPFVNALRQAEADLEKAKVQHETSLTEVNRYRGLSEQGMVSKEQYQTIQDNERGLRAALGAAEAAVENDRLQVEFCSIRAPISGRTGGVGAHEGDLVRASDTGVSLVTINQLSPIYVTFSVPQQNLASISRYREAGTLTVIARPPGQNEAPEQGQLTFIDNTIDATTGTLKLKATFPNEDRRLWPGQFATTTLTLATPTTLVVPAAAVQNGQKGQYVFVVKADQTAEERPVTIERTTEDDAVVASGLQDGETVILDGQLRVLPGKPVAIKEGPGGGGGGPSAAASTASTEHTGKGKKKS
jgi:multidrug efflux system membrane fusion protein